MFSFETFVEDVYSEFKQDIAKDQVKELLELGEYYTRDSPLSTGRRLIIDRIRFNGEKVSDDENKYLETDINYDQKLQTGVNIWIGGNLKGKSSVFKIVKYSLTGKNSLKQNVSKWIKEIIINFSISEKKYTIYLNKEKRLYALLLNGEYDSISEMKSDSVNRVFESKSEVEFKDLIQEFFFKQFSYYSLKWTQKHPSKDKNELVEGETSWITYFKSILLESKDSSDMFGSQGTKILEMLLGIELTFPLNRLKIKKDRLNEEKGKLSQYNDRRKSNASNDDIIANLKEVQNAINSLIESKTNSTLQILLKEYANLLNKKKTEDSEIAALNSSILELEDKLSKANSQYEANKKEYQHSELEIGRSQKKINDINEYIEVGRFFSNLDIKKCPSCSHTISSTKKKIEAEHHRCYVCHEGVDNNNEEELEILRENIHNLNRYINQITNESSRLLKLVNDSAEEYNEILEALRNGKKNKEKFVVDDKLNESLSMLQSKIDQSKDDNAGDDSEMSGLISQRAVLKYQLEEMNKLENGSTEQNDIETKIKVLSFAINRLSNIRYKFGEKVFTRLTEVMLAEINALGLTSISEIKISEGFDIEYKQDGMFINFDNISEGEQLRAKIALYLSLIQLDIEFNLSRHTRFLIIDSPGKEEADENYLTGLSEILRSIQERYGDQLQILIGTAERDLENTVQNQYIFQSTDFLF